MLVAATGSRLSLNASNWRNATNERITALQSLARPLAAEAGTLAAEAASSARTRALAVLAGGLLVVAVMVLLGSILSRTITRPLRQLTEVAGRVRDELPLMTERMATPGDGPGVTLPEIPVTSNDEVGQLARAFRDVNATTLKVAEEQAALRGSIAAMFVNVARRNHVLLSRQLSFIDQLERTEENPDTLENLFRLDHLATRMRRNAESLIVLAGIDAGRRLRRPMPLSDVIRTAVSEIERYDRVDLALQADPPMVGHVALTTAHLLAELLENATQFSNPDTRVTASTTATARGIRVTVTDLGSA
jgi:HAMP domain-containing protein